MKSAREVAEEVAHYFKYQLHASYLDLLIVSIAQAITRDRAERPVDVRTQRALRLLALAEEEDAKGNGLAVVDADLTVLTRVVGIRAAIDEETP